MSQVYVKSKSGGINAPKLHKELEGDPGIAPTCEAVSENAADSNDFKVAFNVALSTGEESALDAVIAAHTLDPEQDADDFLYLKDQTTGLIKKVYLNNGTLTVEK